ncbi:MAG: hypothetical protein HY319_07615, partial [Armatimonadetes bacterium]|nr:hypothetical protein [Armatimonadota bacterium]
MPLLALSVLVSLLWGCGCDSQAASTSLTGGRGGPATSLFALTVNFPPPARSLRGVTDSDQFTVDLLDSESGAPVLEPVTFDRDPPGTLQQTVDLNAPRGALRLGVSFFQDGLLVGAVSQEVDTTHPVEVTVEAQELFRQLPGADVSAEQQRPRAACHPGGFVAVWAGLVPARVRTEVAPAAVSPTAEVFCRRYSSAGLQPQGSEFQVNTSATGNPALAVDVAADDRGSFT